MAALLDAAMSKCFEMFYGPANVDWDPGPPLQHFYTTFKCAPSFVKEGPREMPDDWDIFCSMIPELSAYKFPNLGPKAQFSGLVDQFNNRHVVTGDKVDPVFDRAIDALNFPFHGTVDPPEWTTRPICLPDPLEVFSLYSELSKTAGPGFPYQQRYSLKHELFTDQFPFVYEAVCLRLLCYQYLDMSDVLHSDLVKKYYCDPCTVKVKNELGKWDTKQPRLIYCVTLVDFVIEMLLFKDAVKPVKDSVGEFHSMIGIGFTEAHAKMVQRILAQFGQSLGTDVPKFDFSVSLSENRSSRLGYLKVYKDPDPRFVRMIQNQTIVATSPTFYISSGFLLLSVVLGFVVSGTFLTSMGNTPIRSARSVLAQMLCQCDNFPPADPWRVLNDQFDVLYERAFPGLYPTTRSAGDDNFEKDHPNLIRAYALLGYRIKDPEICTDTLNFCSHTWGPNGLPISNRILKGFAALVCGDVTTPEQLFAFQSEYGNHPSYPELQSLALYVRQGAIKEDLITTKDFIKQVKKYDATKTSTSNEDQNHGSRHQQPRTDRPQFHRAPKTRPRPYEGLRFTQEPPTQEAESSRRYRSSPQGLWNHKPFLRCCSRSQVSRWFIDPDACSPGTRHCHQCLQCRWERWIPVPAWVQSWVGSRWDCYYSWHLPISDSLVLYRKPTEYVGSQNHLLGYQDSLQSSTPECIWCCPDQEVLPARLNSERLDRGSWFDCLLVQGYSLEPIGRSSSLVLPPRRIGPDFRERLWCDSCRRPCPHMADDPCLCRWGPSECYRYRDRIRLELGSYICRRCRPLLLCDSIRAPEHEVPRGNGQGNGQVQGFDWEVSDRDRERADRVLNQLDGWETIGLDRDDWSPSIVDDDPDESVNDTLFISGPRARNLLNYNGIERIVSALEAIDAMLEDEDNDRFRLPPADLSWPGRIEHTKYKKMHKNSLTRTRMAT
jgi:hypothetical protein